MRVSLDSSTFAKSERFEAFAGQFEQLLPPPGIIQSATNLEGVITATLLGAGAVLTEIKVSGDLSVRESRPPRGLRDSSVERVSVGAV